MPQNRSKQLLQRALKVIPGGVNSPVRAFHSVNGSPIFMKSGSGPYIFSVDDQKYIDYIGSWGPLIHGHQNEIINDAIAAVLENSIGFGTATELEITMAELITNIIPSIEMVRMVNSGTEATLSAIRLARGFTGKNKIIKFNGCYHGHSDSLLVQAGSGLLTLGLPDSAGVPSDFTKHTLTAPYNDLSTVKQLFDKFSDDIAAVIVEPIAGNMNLVLPNKEFLSGLRELCSQYNSILIFDEVMTGFRVALGGAQELYNIKPDLTCLGKVIGGGLPVGAFGGRADIMEYLAPIGPVYQAGTLSGNPVAIAAGIASIELLQREKDTCYKTLAENAAYLMRGIQQAAGEYNIDVKTNSVAGMFGIHFGSIEQFKYFHQAMLDEGVYLAPSAFEAGFISLVHSKADLDFTITAARNSFAKLAVAFL